MGSLPHIYADFQNADSQGRVRLNCVGTVQDLSHLQVQLREGLAVLIYEDDPDGSGQNAQLKAEGLVAYSHDEQCWVATIDWQKIRRELTGSPSESQKDASGVLYRGNASEPPPARPASH